MKKYWKSIIKISVHNICYFYNIFSWSFWQNTAVFLRDISHKHMQRWGGKLHLSVLLSGKVSYVTYFEVGHLSKVKQN